MSALPAYAATLLTQAAYTTVPLRSGLGEATVLACDPSGSTTKQADFLWSASLETVTEGGSFPKCPGLDRSLLMIEGTGMDFSSGGKLIKSLRLPFERYPMDGSLAIKTRLVEGPVKMFTVITGNIRVRSDLLTYKLDSRSDGWVPLGGAFHLFYGARGSSEAVYNRTGQSWQLAPGDSLLLNGNSHGDAAFSEYLTLEPATPESVVIGVGIYLKA